MTISEDKLSSNFNKPSDVEQASPPSYPLAETEELVVGGPRCRFRGWRLFRRNGHCSRRTETHSRSGVCQRSSKVVRAVKFLVSGVILLTLIHFVVTGVKVYKVLNTADCATISPADVSGGVDFVVPLPHASNRILVHDSLTGGDSHITHDSSLADGTVKLSVKFSEPSKQTGVYDGCMVQWKRGLGIALIPRESNGTRAEIASLSLHFPSSVTAPEVQLIGKSKLTDKKLRKLIRWWRKHHKKNLAKL